MDILNFISWIRGGRVVSSVDPNKTLIPVGLKDGRRDDDYLAGAISVADFAAQVGGLQTVAVDGVTITGDGTPGDPLVAAGGGAIPVVTVYPTTTPTEAGNQFWYQGNLWHYMTQAEIDSAGWTGLVSVGFPAPVNKSDISKYIYFNNSTFDTDSTGELLVRTFNGIIDFIGLGNPIKVTRIFSSSGRDSLLPYSLVITEFKNASLLKNLQDVGTQKALVFTNNGLTSTVINDLFTQLPPTSLSATIQVSGNPGAGTCNPTIATSKGYIVIV